MICLSLSIVSLPGLRVNITLTCLQAVGTHPLARQDANIQHRCLLVAQFLTAVVQAQFHQFQLTSMLCSYLSPICFGLIDNASIQHTVLVNHKCSQVGPFLPFIGHFTSLVSWKMNPVKVLQGLFSSLCI